MHWILQNNIFDEQGFASLLETLERFDIPHSIHKVVPFVGLLDPEPNLDTKNVICIGSYSMRHSARANEWSPGVYDLEPFHFEIQREKWGKEMLNWDSVVLPFRDITVGEKRKFIRPIEDSKAFAGSVFDHVEFEDWKKKVVELKDNKGSLNGDTLCQVTSVKEIYAEYRCWVVDSRVVTASLYKRGSQVIYSDVVPDHVIRYASGQVTGYDGFNPLPAFVIDVCDTPEGMKIVEINTINSAGFYAADMQKLVMALEDLGNRNSG